MNNLATFATGCFWCGEALFSRLKGVIKVTVGYAGGNASEAHYDLVSTGQTGHAESFQVEFDPTQISYSQLLQVFWHSHDPTSKDQQGNDIGHQYRSVIFYSTPEQQQLALSSLRELTKQGVFTRPIVTEIVPLEKFYRAEEKHQQYFQKHPEQAYCQVVILPKLKKFNDNFQDLLKKTV